MKPILLHYYITNRCNSQCHFCSIWTERPKIDADKINVFHNVQSAREAGCKFVDFTGGEPLLHKDLPEFLSFAKKQGLITSVTTNCLLFPNRVKELAGKIDLLHFSLDGGTAEVHNNIRGADCFDHVMQSISLARDNKLLPDLLFTYTDQNIDSFKDAYAIGRQHKLMLILDPVFSTSGSDTISATTHQKAEEFSRWPGVYLNKAHLLLRKQGGNHIRKPLCRAVSSTIVITPDNCRVLPCYHHRSSSETLTPHIGLRQNNSSIFNDARSRQGSYSFCEGCHINCYFDPSYNYHLNQLFFQSLRSKLLYIIMKYLIYGNFRAFLRLYYAR